MKRTTKFFALVVALIVLLSGCQGLTDTSWAFEHEGQRLPAGTYILFINDAFLRGADMLVQDRIDWDNARIGMEEEYPDQGPPDIFAMTSEEMFDTPLEGMRFYDWVTAEAQNLSRRYFAVNALLAQHEIEPSLEDMAQAMMSASAEYQDGQQFYRQLGVGETSLLLFFIHGVNHGALFEGLYGSGGPYEIPQAEIRAHFDEQFVAGQEIIFLKAEPFLTGDETEEEAAEIIQAAEETNEEIRELAQEFLERLLAGEAFEQLQYEHELEFSPNPENVMRQPPGVLDFLTRRDNVFHHNQAVLDGLDALSVGDAGVFEDEWVIAVVRRLDTLANQDAVDEQMSEILNYLRYEDHFLPMLDELGKTLPLRVNNNAINRYTLGTLWQD